VCSRAAKEHEVRLSEIIDVLNEKFGTRFTPSDQLAVFDAIRAEAVVDQELARRTYDQIRETLSGA
jgi:hypothetical protein